MHTHHHHLTPLPHHLAAPHRILPPRFRLPFYRHTRLQLSSNEKSTYSSGLVSGMTVTERYSVRPLGSARRCAVYLQQHRHPAATYRGSVMVVVVRVGLLSWWW